MNILWDFDGTLFDTYPAYADIIFRVLEGRVPKPEILRQLKISFSRAAGYYSLSESQVQRIFAMERDLHPSKTPPFPYVESVLQFARSNVIVTHKPRSEVMVILAHYGWQKHFAEIIADGDGYPRKPDPASYQYLHQTYNVDLVIGDRELDILPARTLGIKTCLFQNDTPGADYYLSDYRRFFEELDILVRHST